MAWRKGRHIAFDGDGNKKCEDCECFWAEKIDRKFPEEPRLCPYCYTARFFPSQIERRWQQIYQHPFAMREEFAQWWAQVNAQIKRDTWGIYDAESLGWSSDHFEAIRNFDKTPKEMAVHILLREKVRSVHSPNPRR